MRALPFAEIAGLAIVTEISACKGKTSIYRTEPGRSFVFGMRDSFTAFRGFRLFPAFILPEILFVLFLTAILRSLHVARQRIYHFSRRVLFRFARFATRVLIAIRVSA